MSGYKIATWQSFVEALQVRIPKESYETWFRHLSLIEWSSDTLKLSAPNRYVKQWIEGHYHREVLEAARELQGDTVSVDIEAIASSKTAPCSAQLVGQVLNQALATPVKKRKGVSANPGESSTQLLRRQQIYRFDNFVIGGSNRVAYTACQSVVANPAAQYNPLVLHGDHGLGKTHLLQAVASRLQEAHPNFRIKVISCEEFANDFIRACRDKTIEDFREGYRQCHVLLMDDVHFLGGKPKTQQEFQYTFDRIQSMGRQVILTSIVHPREISRLDESLKARLQGGLVVRLSAPTYEARVDLLVAKAESRDLALSRGLAELVAHRVDSSVRELEGVVCKLGAICAADSKKPDRNLVLLALRELGYLKEGPMTLDEVLDAVISFCKVSADDVRSARRHASLVSARHLGMYLSKKFTTFSLGEIGRFYGNRDHSTVLHACRKIDAQLSADDQLKELVETLQRRLGR